ncbi:MAG: glycogen debranching enzyme N-terminal domain-containing protein [Caldisericaceae bacterium]|nr:glycogen debranching enzyme N-terminal domain-containing protein [Caldisericaceae bacterium]
MEIHKDVIKNVNRAQQLEWMDANSKGAYSSSTICGMNTRREHGLLVVPHLTLNRKVVTLAKFEETIFIENKLYEISTNAYKDNIYPHGYQYQEKYVDEPFITFYYKIEDRRIRKVLFLLENQNILLVRYELTNQGRPVTLVIKPFLAVRFNTDLNTETQGLNTDTYLGESFVRWAPRQAMPELYVYFNKGEFIPATLWYHGFVYPKDNGKYKLQTEDLFNPGFFQVDLKPYETFDLFISVHSLEPFKLDFEEQYYLESKRRKGHYFKYVPGKENFKRLAKNFQRSVFIEEGRLKFPISHLQDKPSTFFFIQQQLNFLYLSSNYELIKNSILDLLKNLDGGILPSNYPFKDQRPVYNQVDLSLWLIEVINRYFVQTNDLKFIEKIFDTLREIIDSFHKGTNFNTYTSKDGLIFSGEKKISVSWIPLKTNSGDVLRYGLMLENNALWFNALKIMETFANKLGKKRLSFKYRQLAKKVAKSFTEKFILPDQSGFYDFINFNESNNDYRINQIIPLILSFKPFNDDLALKVLKRIEEELLTPYGLRSRSIYDANFASDSGKFNGNKNGQFFNGAIWPWTISWYIRVLVSWPENKNVIKIWQNYFAPLFELSETRMIGYLPEAVIFDGSLKILGIEDFLPAVSSLVLADYLISLAKSQTQEPDEANEQVVS